MPASCQTSRQAHATSNGLEAPWGREHGRNRGSAPSACCALEHFPIRFTPILS